MKRKMNQLVGALVLGGTTSIASAGLEFSTTEIGSFILTLAPTPEVSNDGVVAYYDGQAQSTFLWNGEQVLSSISTGNPFSHNMFSSDGLFAVHKSVSGTDFLYHTPEGVIELERTGGPLHLSGDGRRIARPRPYYENTWYIWDYQGADAENSLRKITVDLGLTGSVSTLNGAGEAMNGDGSRFLVKNDGTVYFVDIEEPTDNPYFGTATTTAIPVDFASVRGLSADGANVLGLVREFEDGCAWGNNVLYSEAGGLVNIGCSRRSLDEPLFNATDVSGDGSKVIGYSQMTVGGNFYNPEIEGTSFIWDNINGKRDLKDVLANHGYDISDWTVLRATDISTDGSKVTGWGIDAEGTYKVFLAEVVLECSTPF